MARNSSNKRNIILGIIVVIVVIFVIAGISSPKEASAASNSNSSSSQSVSKTFKIGETIKMGKYDITINSLNNTQNITQGGISNGKTNNNFAIFKLTLENTSNNPIPGFLIGNGNNIFMLNSKNSNYNADTNSTIEANVGYNTNNASSVILDGTQLNPHAKYVLYLSFITPKPAKTGTLTLNIANEVAKVQL